MQKMMRNLLGMSMAAWLLVLHGAAGFVRTPLPMVHRGGLSSAGMCRKAQKSVLATEKCGHRKVWLRLRTTTDEGEWEDICGDGGCLKQIITIGSGDGGNFRPRKGSLVRLHYEIRIDGKVLDSSRGPGSEVFEFELGVEPSDVIAGWEHAIPTMLEGETARLLCAPAYAFGAAGAPPKVPANATVDCTLELISFVDKTEKWASLADQYTGSDVPEEEVYNKYKEDIETGDQKGMTKDFNIGPPTSGGKEREVYALDDIRLKKLAAPNQRIGGKFKNYKWTETDKMMDLFVLLPQDITTRDLEVDIKRDALRVGIKGSSDSPLLEGPLHGIVRASECWWVVTDEGGQRCVHAQLQKLPPYDILWASVIKGDGGAGNPLSVQ